MLGDTVVILCLLKCRLRRGIGGPSKGLWWGQKGAWRGRQGERGAEKQKGRPAAAFPLSPALSRKGRRGAGLPLDLGHGAVQAGADAEQGDALALLQAAHFLELAQHDRHRSRAEIGRASCREGVEGE